MARNGACPPSSTGTRSSVAAAFAVSSLSTAFESVKVSPPDHRRVQRRVADLRRTRGGDHGDHSGGEAGIDHHLHGRDRAQRGLVGGLGHRRAPGRDGRCELAGQHGDRVVPRRDGRDHADRLAPRHEPLAGPRRGGSWRLRCARPPRRTRPWSPRSAAAMAAAVSVRSPSEASSMSSPVWPGRRRERRTSGGGAPLPVDVDRASWLSSHG